MTDVEGQPPVNPYRAAAAGEFGGTGGELSRYHPLTVLKRLVYVGGSGYALHRFQAYHVILQSPQVRHEWFKIGLAATIALLGLKAYVEVYEGRMRKTKVDYEHFRQTTHAAIGLFMFSSLCYHIAIWPHYGWNSIVVLNIAFFGVILQFMLLIPSWLQNILSGIALTFFLQEYS